jgi:hypothetical protein
MAELLFLCHYLAVRRVATEVFYQKYTLLPQAQPDRLEGEVYLHINTDSYLSSWEHLPERVRARASDGAAISCRAVGAAE